jgi:hypothetical protein
VEMEVVLLLVAGALWRRRAGTWGRGPVHAPKAQAGFPGLASAHKSWVGLWWVRVGDGGPVTSEVVREADWRDPGGRHVWG